MTTARTERTVTHGWLMWAVGAVFFGYTFLHRVAPSVIFDHLMREFAGTAAVLGNLAGCYFYAYAGMQIPAGMLLDRFGPRRMLTLSATVCALGSALFAAADSLYVAYASRLLLGAGSGIAFIGTLKLVSDWLPHRFALLTGLTMTLALACTIGGQAPLAGLVEVIGWRASMWVGAALGLGFAALIWLTARDGITRDARAPRETAAPTPIADLFRAVLANRQILLVALYCGCVSGPVLAFIGLWGVAYLVQVHGLDRVSAGAGASLILAGMAAGAPTMGWLSDRMGRRKPLMQVSSIVVCGGWLVLLTLPEPSRLAVYVLLFVIGFASSSMALTYVMARELSPLRVSAFATGTVNFIAIAAGAVLQPVVGFLLDMQWDGTASEGVRVFTSDAYVNAFLPFAGLAVLMFVTTFFLRETFTRPAAPGAATA